MDDVEVAKIAARLTIDQRKAMGRAELDGNLGRYFVRFISGPVAKGLIKAGLGTAVWSGVVLSALGERVAQHLKQENAK